MIHGPCWRCSCLWMVVVLCFVLRCFLVLFLFLLSGETQVRKESDVPRVCAASMHQHHRVQLCGVVHRQHGGHRRRRNRCGDLHVKPSGGICRSTYVHTCLARCIEVYDGALLGFLFRPCVCVVKAPPLVLSYDTCFYVAMPPVLARACFCFFLFLFLSRRASTSRTTRRRRLLSSRTRPSSRSSCRWVEICRS